MGSAPPTERDEKFFFFFFFFSKLIDLPGSWLLRRAPEHGGKNELDELVQGAAKVVSSLSCVAVPVLMPPTHGAAPPRAGDRQARGPRHSSSSPSSSATDIAETLSDVDRQRHGGAAGFVVLEPKWLRTP
uniref:Uncharacterized protein n=1 Tax=Prorocentrum micans TaxID=2945 RepID=A0A7S2TG20_PROMC